HRAVGAGALIATTTPRREIFTRIVASRNSTTSVATGYKPLSKKKLKKQMRKLERNMDRAWDPTTAIGETTVGCRAVAARKALGANRAGSWGCCPLRSGFTLEPRQERPGKTPTPRVIKAGMPLEMADGQGRAQLAAV